MQCVCIWHRKESLPRIVLHQLHCIASYRDYALIPIICTERDYLSEMLKVIKSIVVVYCHVKAETVIEWLDVCLVVCRTAQNCRKSTHKSASWTFYTYSKFSELDSQLIACQKLFFIAKNVAHCHIFKLTALSVVEILHFENQQCVNCAEMFERQKYECANEEMKERRNEWLRESWKEKNLIYCWLEKCHSPLARLTHERRKTRNEKCETSDDGNKWNTALNECNEWAIWTIHNWWTDGLHVAAFEMLKMIRYAKNNNILHCTSHSSSSLLTKQNYSFIFEISDINQSHKRRVNKKCEHEIRFAYQNKT